MTDQSQFIRQLFHGNEPEQPAATIAEPTTGPVIPGQEKQPDYVNKTSTSAFIDNLFNN